MTDLATGSVKSIVPKFRAHPLEIMAIAFSFFFAVGLILFALFDGWPVKYAAIAVGVYLGSFAYAAVRKWNVEGWPEWTMPFQIFGGLFAVFFIWWAMPLENNREKRGLILHGRFVVIMCAMITYLTFTLAGWWPWGLIAVAASLLTYGKATLDFITSDSDDDDGGYEITGSWR